jgi:deoxyribodipyrimidine photo-lyase
VAVSSDDLLARRRPLNDFYEIDGADPSGYVGVLWSVAGAHDRPWCERAIFAQVRYVNDAGLRRKFKIDSYGAQFPE